MGEFKAILGIKLQLSTQIPSNTDGIDSVQLQLKVILRNLKSVKEQGPAAPDRSCVRVYQLCLNTIKDSPFPGSTAQRALQLPLLWGPGPLLGAASMLAPCPCAVSPGARVCSHSPRAAICCGRSFFGWWECQELLSA